MTELDRIHAALTAATGTPVLVSLMRVSGSAYRGPGARMVVLEDGANVGAISGGCLEKDAVAHAAETRAAGRARVVTYDLTRDDDKPWGLGMGCNATLEVLFEPITQGPPPWLERVRQAHARRESVVLATAFGADGAPPGTRTVHHAGSTRDTEVRGGVLYEYLPPPLLLVLFGDGADTAPLAALGDQLGWLVRPVRKDDDAGPLDERTAAVVMSHNYQRDLDLLPGLLAGPAPYVGILGPRSRTRRLLADLAARDFQAAPHLAARLRGPVGLDIGAETPEEIALAIAAEIRAAFAGRPGGALADRPGPIHDR